jgi:hypothetical protein
MGDAMNELNFLDALGCLAWLAFPAWLLLGRFLPHREHRIDSSVKNKIVGYDGHGRYLVEAKTSRQITGPRPHVDGNLPAGLYQVKKGLWIVDTSRNGTPPPADEIDWKSVNGYSINPRGNTKTNGFLSDKMVGWEHNYIKKDD